MLTEHFFISSERLEEFQDVKDVTFLKDVTYDNKQGFTLSLEDIFFKLTPLQPFQG